VPNLSEENARKLGEVLGGLEAIADLASLLVDDIPEARRPAVAIAIRTLAMYHGTILDRAILEIGGVPAGFFDEREGAEPE
jgi:hypothetical protein